MTTSALRARLAALPTARGPRRGAALLIALVALSVLTMSGVAALRAASRASLGAGDEAFKAQAEALESDLEEIALAEFARDPDGIFIKGQGAADPSGWVEMVAADGPAGFSVRAHALDLSGRLHLRASDSSASAGLPPELQAVRALAPVARRRVRAGSLPLTLADALATTLGDKAALVLYPSRANSEAATTWITDRGSGALNLSTCPLPLLRAALRGRDPGMARQVILARERDEPLPVAAASLLNAPPRSVANAAHLSFSVSTDAVALLVEVRQGGRVARWWLAAEPAPPGSAAGAPGLSTRVVRPLPAFALLCGESEAPPPHRLNWRIVERRRIG